MGPGMVSKMTIYGRDKNIAISRNFTAPSSLNPLENWNMLDKIIKNEVFPTNSKQSL